MYKISISDNLKFFNSNIQLGCISAILTNTTRNENLWTEIDQYIDKISILTTEQIKQIPQIAYTRAMYSALGKEPSRYRPSAEALMRRVILNKSLYNVNTVVDIINLASIATGYSIGGYDYSKIVGNILFDKANDNFDYDAIGRGKLNIDGLPVLFDQIGAFGNPTSDSVRTSISIETKEILLIVFNFGSISNFENDIKYIAELFAKYCNAKNFSINFF